MDSNRRLEVSELVDVARFVVETLSHQDWVNLDSKEVTVLELSKGKVFKVSPPTGCPVVLRNFSSYSDLAVRRMLAAASILAQHGLAPSQIAVGSNWYLEPFVVGSESTVDTLEDCRALGKFTAEIHKIPPEWFDDLRREFVSRTPVLEKVELGSKIWSYIMCSGPFTVGPLATDDALCVHYAASVRPTTSVGARLVTSHGDYYPPNVVKLEDGRLICLDLEFTCSNYAVEDLSSMLGNIHSVEKRRAFIEAYLDELGESTDIADSLLLDCELSGIGGWDFGSRLSCLVLENRTGKEVREAIAFCNNVAAEIHGSEELSEIAVRDGVEAAIAETKTLQMLLHSKFYAKATSSAIIRAQSGGKMEWKKCIEQAHAFELERAKL